MIRVLFVDDPAVLSARRVQLRDRRDRWAMSFLGDPRDARRLLDEHEVDVVVAGMAARGAKGGSFLDDVRELRPDAIRIMSSVAGDGTAPIRDLAVAHQALSTSADARQLVQSIERSLLVRSRLTDPDLRALVGGLSDLPSPPSTVIELRSALLDLTPDPARVARLIADDVAISTKVLQLVNSAFYGMPQPLTDPLDAARYLGSRAIAELVMSDQMLAAFRGRSPEMDATVDRIHERSVRRADVVMELASRSGRSATEARGLWTGAFLADVGQLVLVGAPDGVRARVQSAHDDDGVGEPDAVTPATVGAHLISTWGLPHRLVETVPLSDVATFVHGADGAALTWLARLVSEGRWEPGRCSARDLSTVGLTPSDLEAVAQGRALARVG